MNSGRWVSIRGSVLSVPLKGPRRVLIRVLNRVWVVV